METPFKIPILSFMYSLKKPHYPLQKLPIHTSTPKILQGPLIYCSESLVHYLLTTNNFTQTICGHVDNGCELLHYTNDRTIEEFRRDFRRCQFHTIYFKVLCSKGYKKMFSPCVVVWVSIRIRFQRYLPISRPYLRRQDVLSNHF